MKTFLEIKIEECSGKPIRILKEGASKTFRYVLISGNAGRSHLLVYTKSLQTNIQDNVGTNKVSMLYKMQHEF